MIDLTFVQSYNFFRVFQNPFHIIIAKAYSNKQKNDFRTHKRMRKPFSMIH